MCFELRKERKDQHKQYLKYSQYIVNDINELNQFKYSSKLIIDKTDTIKIREMKVCCVNIFIFKAQKGVYRPE